ncbi:MAG: TonB-dependent receptor plug domain-containing protein, partial [Verrucomicrobiia bacterium]
MHTINKKTLRRSALLAFSALLTAGSTWAQSTAESSVIDEEETIVLSPFEVSADEEQGYAAATTLAGNRLNTELRDIGNAVTVVTKQFLDDIGAVDNESLLQYTVGTEVGNVQGNFTGTGDGALLDESGRFTNPNQNTRIRGLAAADNTRDYFLSNIPWDGYNVDRVDLQRGPNSILFGQGSPAGIINVGTKQAMFNDSNEVTFRVASFGSVRGTVDFNRV